MFKYLVAFLLLPTLAWAQCGTAGFIGNCPGAVNPQASDTALCWQPGQTPHTRQCGFGQYFNSGLQAKLDVSPSTVTVPAGSPVKTSTFIDLTPNPYNYDSSVKNDCTVDATASILAAINAAMGSTSVGGAVHIPKGCWLVSGVGAEMFLLTSPVEIYGDGDSTEIRVASTTDASTKVFHVYPSASNFESYKFKNFRIGGQGGGSYAASYFDWDTTNATATGQRNGLISHVNMLTQSASGHNVTTTYSSGNGTYNLLFDHVESIGCLYLNGAGDSINILASILSGTSCGVYLNQASGAGAFLALGTNNSAQAGAYIFAGGTAPLVDGGEIEVQAPNPHGSVIDATGTGTGLVNLTLRNVQVQNPATYVTITGAIATTTLTVTVTSGAIYEGYGLKEASGASTPVVAGTTIVSQLTGTPHGTGTYTVSQSQTVSSESLVAAPTLVNIGASAPNTTIIGSRFSQPVAVTQPDILLNGAFPLVGGNWFFNSDGSPASYVNYYDNSSGTSKSVLLCSGVVTTSCQLVPASLSLGGAPIGTLTLTNVAPSIYTNVTGNAADQSLWSWLTVGTTILARAVNDTNSAAHDWLEVHRGSGYTIADVTLPPPVILGSTLRAGSLDTTCTAKPTGTIALIGAAGTGFLTICP